MPPENWCGYSLTRSLGLGMPTRSSTSTARSMRLRLADVPVQQHRLGDLLADGHASGSATSAGPGRSSRRRCRGPGASPRLTEVSRSPARPAESGRSAIAPPSGSSRMIDSAVIVLPQPDSPTMPSVSPGRPRSVTPSTACTVPLAQLDLGVQVGRSPVPEATSRRQPFYRRCSRVSNASRSASPMKLNAMQVRMIAMPGRIDQPPVARPLWRYCRPPESMRAPVGVRAARRRGRGSRAPRA